LGSDQPKDLSAYNQAIKAMAFQGANIHVVTPSRWLAACAAKSALFSQFPVSVIPNSVPTEVFMPLDKELVRRELGLPVDKPVVLFGAQSQSNLRKGPDFLIEALHAYRGSENALDVTIVSFGECPDALASEFGENWVNLGAVYDMFEQAKIYSAADVFVLPSREDNLPNTMLESLACGTPVISFRTGGMPDMVRHGRTGYLAPAFEIEGLAQGLRWALHVDSEKASERRVVCRQFALNTFTMRHQAQRYGELYACLTEESSRVPASMDASLAS
jgi:glycosyltransferase involved in cell wall biosynthesis